MSGLKDDAVAQGCRQAIEERRERAQEAAKMSTGCERVPQTGHSAHDNRDTCEPGGCGAVHVGLDREVLRDIRLQTAVNPHETGQGPDLRYGG